MALPGMIAWGRPSGGVPVVWNSADKTASLTLSNGDKTATCSASSQGVRGNQGKSSGKWYFEIAHGSNAWSTGGNYIFGVATAAFATLGSTGVGTASGSAGVQFSLNNYRLNGGTAVGSNPDPGNGGANVVCMFAVDLTAGNIWFGVSGTWGGVAGVTGVPATGTAPSLTGLSGTYFPCASLGGNSNICHLYASAADCTYSLPSGFSYWSA
jgi:hypothetical protein